MPEPSVNKAHPAKQHTPIDAETLVAERDAIMKNAVTAQQQALDEQACVWVSANAGTGKTYVLIHRILRLLVTDSALKPNEILAVTFTRAAAQEIAARVRDVLQQWQDMSAETLQQTLHSLLQRPATAAEQHRARTLLVVLLDDPFGLNINTIHGFCQSLLAAFPLEAGISPHFSIVEDNDAKQLMQQAQNTVFERHGSGNGAPAWVFAWMAGLTHDTVLRDYFTGFIHNFRRYQKLFEENNGLDVLLTKLANALAVPTKLTPATADVWWWQHAAPNPATLVQLQQLLPLLRAGSSSEITLAEKMSPFFAATTHAEKQLAWPAFVSAFLTDKETPRARLATKKLMDAAPYAENVLHTAQQSVLQATQTRHSLNSYLFTAAYLTLGQQILTEYEQLKQQQHVLDYNDMIHKTRLLYQKAGVAEWVSYKTDSRIKHVMLDEAQDTDSDQWHILRSLMADFFSGEGQTGSCRTFFAVGDMKQSIYRFRGAEPEVFRTMLGFMAQARTTGQPQHEVAMTTSFRSSEAVLNATDYIFADPTLRHAIDAELNQPLQHSAGKHHGKAGWVEIWPPLNTPAEEEQPDTPASAAAGWRLPHMAPPAAPTGKNLLAEKVALSIKQLLNSRTVLATTNLPVSAGDVMILLRSRTMMGEIIHALNQHNLPHTGADQMNLNENPVVEDLVALARFLLNPWDDLNFVHTLRSPLFCCSHNHIVALKAEQKHAHASLWAVLYHSTTAPRPLQQAKQQLMPLLQQSNQLSPYQMIQRAINHLHARGRLLAAFADSANEAALQVVNEPIDAFLSALLQFEQQHKGCLIEFLNMFELQGLSYKKELSAAAGGIRILTVHGAKGLEAPVVYLPDTTRGFYDDFSREKVLWQQNAEGKDELCLFRAGEGKKSVLEQRLEEHEKHHIFNDELRLLYVALTRARERIYVGAANKPAAASWYRLIETRIEADNTLWQNIDGNRVLHSPQRHPLPRVDVMHDTSATPPSALPAWLHSHNDSHTETLVSPSDAVRQTELSETAGSLKNKNLYRKGVLLHRLLHMLPQTQANTTQVENWLTLIAPDIPAEERTQMVQQIQTIINRHAFIFNPETSRAEVPVVAWLTPHTRLEGHIDRLIVEENRVLVVDFKTNRKVPKTVPKAYQKQLAAYKQALAATFPQAHIQTALLWTQAPEGQQLVYVDVQD